MSNLLANQVIAALEKNGVIWGPSSTGARFQSGAFEKSDTNIEKLRFLIASCEKYVLPCEPDVYSPVVELARSVAAEGIKLPDKMWIECPVEDGNQTVKIGAVAKTVGTNQIAFTVFVGGAAGILGCNAFWMTIKEKGEFSLQQYRGTAPFCNDEMPVLQMALDCAAHTILMINRDPEYVVAKPAAFQSIKPKKASRINYPYHSVTLTNKIYLPSGNVGVTGHKQGEHMRSGSIRTYRAARYTNMRGKTQVVGPYRAGSGPLKSIRTHYNVPSPMQDDTAAPSSLT